MMWAQKPEVRFDDRVLFDLVYEFWRFSAVFLLECVCVWTILC